MLAALGARARARGATRGGPLRDLRSAAAPPSAPPRSATSWPAGATRVEYHGRAADVPGDLARYIDHTLLRPDAAAADIDRLCAEAAEHRFAAVCINPTWVRRAAENLRGTDVAVASVIGFPFGAAHVARSRRFEARRAIRDGAREIDMVINIGALKSGMHDLVREDIARVSDACHESGAANKVIIEAALLTDEEKVIACRLAQQAKADMVKTSTGYAKGGATVFDVALMRETVGPEDGRQGGRRDPHRRGRAGHDRGRGHPHRGLGRRQHREGEKGAHGQY